MMTHEQNVEVARQYHARNQALVKWRSWQDAGVMLRMQTSESVRERVRQIVDEEIMPRLAMMRRQPAA